MATEKQQQHGNNVKQPNSNNYENMAALWIHCALWWITYTKLRNPQKLYLYRYMYAAAAVAVAASTRNKKNALYLKMAHTAKHTQRERERAQLRAKMYSHTTPIG